MTPISLCLSLAVPIYIHKTQVKQHRPKPKTQTSSTTTKLKKDSACYLTHSRHSSITHGATWWRGNVILRMLLTRKTNISNKGTLCRCTLVLSLQKCTCGLSFVLLRLTRLASYTGLRWLLPFLIICSTDDADTIFFCCLSALHTLKIVGFVDLVHT